MRWLGYLATVLWWSGIARSLSSLNRGHSYKISPKPCRVPGPGGGEGTCMFVWECIKSEGTHVGVCVDTFMFGSCCVHNSTSNNVNSQQASLPNTLRPSLADALADETTRPTLTSLASFGKTPIGSSRPQPDTGTSSRPHSQRPRPTTPSPRPGRPPQKRPNVKPNTNQDTNRLQTSMNQSGSQEIRPQAVNAQSSNHGSQPGIDSEVTEDATNSWWNSENKNKPSQSSLEHQHNTKTRPDDSGHHQEQPFGSRPNDAGNEEESSGTDHAYKDKVDDSHNTLVIQLPGNNQAPESEQNKLAGPKQKPRPHRPGVGPGSGQNQKPSVAQRPSESRPDDSKTEDTDLVVQETMHRPSLNSVDENETAGKPYPNLNFIHTERPQWATKPAASHKPSTDYSKPYFSIKTTTYRPSSISDHADTGPNFISKPENESGPTKASTTSKPTYYSSQSTSAAGSGVQISHWQMTTEPAFVTKHKPSSLRPPTILETTRPSGSSSHFWSENSWTPPRPSLKPHWTDNPAWMENSSEISSQRPVSRPGFKPTKPSQEHTEYKKPLGSAHYITTSYIETSTKPRPTKKTTTTTTTTTTEEPTTTKATTTASTTTTTKATTVQETETSTKTASTGSVMTVSAAESKTMQCGVPPLFPRPETRIVGGKDASFGRWPWQVSVRRTSFFGFSSTHRCGGAVLNENWIATAGHCVDDLLTSQIRIRVGEYDFSSVQERLPFVERGVAKKVVHPKYNFFTYEYDLALVRLESSLTFAPHISPICLPATDDLLIGENATVTGWGRLSEGGTLPSVLQEVSVPIVSNDRCKSMFLRAGRHEFIPDIFLCAGYETGGQDSCQGDSGGPLQVRGKDGRYFLAGIISWGIGCAEANLPGVCTRISKFVPWILKNVT